jgi:hypothetical protein
VEMPMRFPVISMSAFFAQREIFRSIQEKPYLDYENRFLVAPGFLLARDAESKNLFFALVEMTRSAVAGGNFWS